MTYIEKKLRIHTYNVICDTILLVVIPMVMFAAIFLVNDLRWLFLVEPPLMFTFSIILDRRRYNERERRSYACIVNIDKTSV